MASDTTPPVAETPAVDPTSATPPAGNPVPETPAVEEQIPLSKYKEKKAEAERLQRRLNELEKAKTDAEQQAAIDQGKFKELYENSDKRVKELEPVAANYQRLADLTVSRVQAEIKDWSAEVKAFLPSGDNVDPLALLEAVEKARPVAEKLKQPTTARAGNPGNPPATGPVNTTAAQTAEQELRTSGRYSSF